jgi:hypothetical protein
VNFPEDQLAELKRLCPGASWCQDGGIGYFLLPALSLPDGCAPKAADALLCPTPRDGYNSRLFFDRVVSSRQALNWHMQNVRIAERNWNAYSWKLNRTDLRLAQIIGEHLRALR